MKEFALEAMPPQIQALFDSAQAERVLVSRNGKPYAVVMCIQYQDQEDLRLEADPEFWQMIEERRKEPTIPLAQLKAELFPQDQ